MKMTVIDSTEQIEKVAPKISKYSNTQNRVSTADFSANDPFHISLEKLSNSIWAPDPTGGGQQTMWFYERARGSYDETRNRERTPARIRTWDAIHPRKQKFDKVMLAKIEETWALRPFIVSRGGQKNFLEFAIEMGERGTREVDEEYYRDLISKLIIWKSAEKIISDQNEPGYRANIVTYTLSWLLYLTGQRINLQNVWKTQAIGEGLKETIDFLSFKARHHILSTDDNVTEFCKRENCWNELLKETIQLPSSVNTELIDTSKPTGIIGGQRE